MNVFRALARELVQTVQSFGRRDLESQRTDSLQPVRDQQRVPPVVALARYRDSFDQLPQGMQALKTLGMERASQRATQAFAARDAWQATRDSFSPARRSPVDLQGGVTVAAPDMAEQPKPAAITPNGFLASLDDVL